MERKTRPAYFVHTFSGYPGQPHAGPNPGPGLPEEEFDHRLLVFGVESRQVETNDTEEQPVGVGRRRISILGRTPGQGQRSRGPDY